MTQKEKLKVLRDLAHEVTVQVAEDDNITAHEIEDQLMNLALTLIPKCAGMGQVKEIVEVALSTEDFKFERWYG